MNTYTKKSRTTQIQHSVKQESYRIELNKQFQNRPFYRTYNWNNRIQISRTTRIVFGKNKDDRHSSNKTSLENLCNCLSQTRNHRYHQVCNITYSHLKWSQRFQSLPRINKMHKSRRVDRTYGNKSTSPSIEEYLTDYITQRRHCWWRWIIRAINVTLTVLKRRHHYHWAAGWALLRRPERSPKKQPYTKTSTMKSRKTRIQHPVKQGSYRIELNKQYQYRRFYRINNWSNRIQKSRTVRIVFGMNNDDWYSSNKKSLENLRNSLSRPRPHRYHQACDIIYSQLKW